MRPVVHILATCRNKDLLKATLLVFNTIRIGFPSATVVVWGNGLESSVSSLVAEACRRVGAQFVPVQGKSHGEWIEALLNKEEHPFWICDTDIVFFERVEDWFDGSEKVLFAGRHEPEFFERWTKSIHVARLHPSLMFLNSNHLRAAIRGWNSQDYFFQTVEMNLIKWNFVPYKDRLVFYDTTAGLHHALKGTEFNEQQNRSFGHLFCGTYSNLVVDSVDLTKTHEAIFENPSLARLLWDAQREWYCKNQVEGVKD